MVRHGPEGYTARPYPGQEALNQQAEGSQAVRMARERQSRAASELRDAEAQLYLLKEQAEIERQIEEQKKKGYATAEAVKKIEDMVKQTGYLRNGLNAVQIEMKKMEDIKHIDKGPGGTLEKMQKAFQELKRAEIDDKDFRAVNEQILQMESNMGSVDVALMKHRREWTGLFDNVDSKLEEMRGKLMEMEHLKIGKTIEDIQMQTLGVAAG